LSALLPPKKSAQIKQEQKNLEAFYFGPTNKELFGIYTPRSCPATRDAAVLLCYPFGQEYMRAHMAYRQLATLLSRAGLPVMRFDYYATGDSYGDCHNALLSTWLENTDEALEELKAISGASQIYLIGLRLGALIAAKIAEERKDVKKLVLWDPFVSGEEYLQEISQQSNVSAQSGNWWIKGYPMSETFRSSILDENICNTSFRDHTRILQVISHENKSFKSLADTFDNRLEQRLVPSPSNWNYSDSDGNILLPHLITKTINDWLVS
jgi:esterase/lipase